jgi:ATP-dependent RNA helicase DeaD
MSIPVPGFSELDLVAPLIKVVKELGYESPLPIQAACIPPLLEGRDVLGLAQTGTGKTAAFALPLLSRIDLAKKAPQVLVLTPTRELAIQVAEAFQTYARYMRGFHVLPIYGGQRYSFQFSQLHRGPQVIVGTPGRVQDHLDRGTLDLSGIQSLVLDEADEMLRMGFVEAVESILTKVPDERQVALFSATMPAQIKRISSRYMKNPVEIRIDAKTTTADNIEQFYMLVPNASKFEALVRILETESYDGILIFSRTRVSTTDLAEKLAARGFEVAPLNGDMTQVARERTIKRLKNGNIDIVVATDVAARGLDVDRISLVINFDIPGDSEAYIHRIGRTGRVGRYGKAILFANPREKRLLSFIERATRKPLVRMEMPSFDVVTRKRVEGFKEKLETTMNDEPQKFYRDLCVDLSAEMHIDMQQLAAGLLCMAQKDRPLQAENNRALASPQWKDSGTAKRDRGSGKQRMSKNLALYRVEVGSTDGVEVRNILGAVANETGLQGKFIGQIRIHAKYATIELPDDLPRNIIEHLQTTYVAQKPLNISRTRGEDAPKTETSPPLEKRPQRVTKPARDAKPARDEKPTKAKKPKKPKKTKKEKLAKALKKKKAAKKKKKPKA